MELQEKIKLAELKMRFMQENVDADNERLQLLSKACNENTASD